MWMCMYMISSNWNWFNFLIFQDIPSDGCDINIMGYEIENALSGFASMAFGDFSEEDNSPLLQQFSSIVYIDMNVEQPEYRVTSNVSTVSDKCDCAQSNFQLDQLLGRSWI